MKLIHCADLHLDSKMTANLSKEQAKERRVEILRTFHRMVEYASVNHVTGILIAGDLFDTRTISATARNMVYNTIVEHGDLEFFYLKGNHDDDNFLSKLDAIPENLHMFQENWTSYSLGPVQIAGVELNADNANQIYHSLVLPHGSYNIVMLHGQLSGYGSKTDAQAINLDQLKNKNIDYLALGHVHTRVADKLDSRGMYAYSGCLEGRGYDECGEKGFIELNIDEDALTATYRFVPIAARTLHELPVDMEDVMSTNEAAKKIEAAINEAAFPANSLVKILLVGEIDVESEINIDYLQEMFSEYFYSVKVKDETRLLIRYSDYEKDESLKGEFVRLVMNSDLSDEEKTEVIRCGILALSGEEV